MVMSSHLLNKIANLINKQAKKLTSFRDFKSLKSKISAKRQVTKMINRKLKRN